MEVHTPLNTGAWEEALREHPDKQFSGYVVRGLRNGFRIGAVRSQRIRSADRNLPSAAQHPGVITDYLSTEARLGRMIGPLHPSTLSGTAVQINRVGAIPKGHSGKWRIITDLSHPPGLSVNNAINPELCSMAYTTVERVARRAMQLGRGALMVKVDIEAGYRLVPVHPEDRPLLGVRWEGSIYLDTMLPFGLRSAAKIFNVVADALQWLLHQQGVEELDHYLDDFVMWGASATRQCHRALTRTKQLCARLELPLVADKTVGPTTCLTFLGITIDTEANELRLPEEKLAKLKTLLGEWGDEKLAAEGSWNRSWEA